MKLRPLTCEIAAGNVHVGYSLKRKVLQFVRKLRDRLVHFPQDSLALHLSLQKSGEEFRAGFTLRLPSHQLHAEKAGTDLLGAIELAGHILLKDLDKFKAIQRGESAWKQRGRQAKLAHHRMLRTEGVGPLESADVLLRDNYELLIEDVRRRLEIAALQGEIPRAAVEPEDIVDEVARTVLAIPEGTHRVRLFELAHEEVQRRCQSAFETVALTREQMLESQQEEEEDVDRAPDLTSEELEQAEDYNRFADGHALSPELRAEVDDLIASIGEESPEDQALFELHFVQGFDPSEIAMIEGQPRERIRERIESLRRRIRERQE